MPNKKISPIEIKNDLLIPHRKKSRQAELRPDCHQRKDDPIPSEKPSGVVHVGTGSQHRLKQLAE